MLHTIIDIITITFFRIMKPLKFVGGVTHTSLFFFVLTSLPSCSPSHMENQTQPANPPSGCISDRPSLHLHGNRGHMGATHPSSGGTNSAVHIHSVSNGKKSKNVLIKAANQKQRTRHVIYVIKVILTLSIRPLAPALKLPANRHTFEAFPSCEKIVLF